MANEPTNPGEYIPMVERWQLDAGKQIFTPVDEQQQEPAPCGLGNNPTCCCWVCRQANS